MTATPRRHQPAARRHRRRVRRSTGASRIRLVAAAMDSSCRPTIIHTMLSTGSTTISAPEARLAAMNDTEPHSRTRPNTPGRALRRRTARLSNSGSVEAVRGLGQRVRRQQRPEAVDRRQQHVAGQRQHHHAPQHRHRTAAAVGDLRHHRRDQDAQDDGGADDEADLAGIEPARRQPDRQERQIDPDGGEQRGVDCAIPPKGYGFERHSGGFRMNVKLN